MKKKAMEDMKPRGVRITQISRESVNPSASKVSAKKEQVSAKPDPEPVKEELVPEAFKPETPKPAPVTTYPTFRDKKQMIFSTPKLPRVSGGIRKPFLIALIAVLLVGVIYWGSSLLQNINITVVEKHQSFTLDHMQFTASSEADAPVAFEIMIVSDEQVKDITLTKSQDVSIKAQGVITLYNEYSTKTQNLLIHTMVSDPKGKTYQTDKAVTIPGYKLDASKKVIPGTLDVGITAFLAGESYNGSPATFSINGFKGTDKFKKIYGKLKTPLTGGAQGLVYTLGPEEKGSLNATAVSSFKSSLIKKVNAQVPAGYILYPSAMSFSYQADDNTLSPTPNGKLKISGTMASVIVKEKNLSEAIVKNLLPKISKSESSEIELPNLSTLSFNFVNEGQAIVKDMKQVSFNLSGPLSAVWHPDVEKLKSDIIGLPKSDLTSIFKLDPGIASASARIFPPWQSYIPTNPSRVHIKVK